MSVTNTTYSNPSQLLQRNEALFEGKNILVAGNIDDNYPLHLQSLASSSTFCFSDYRHFSAIEAQLTQSERVFTDNYQSNSKFNLLLIYMPKAKQEVQYLLANLCPYLTPNAAIILVGEKKCGIKSAASLLKPYADNINMLDSARHCSILYCELSHPVATFKQSDWIKTYPISVNDINLEVCSLPGVFSHGELDKGSELLLQNLPKKLTGNLLDFGCGAGVLGCYLLKNHPELEIDMVDINAYALASAKLTMIKNKLNANIFPSNVFSDIDKKYNTLLSNPPFHSGKETNYVAAETFINQSSKHLKTAGALIIVANKFLRYEPLLSTSYKKMDIVAQNNKFKVLMCLNK
ncbi:16S rRNA (guanine(1207)-N(2))-methyltransferase RsmC [Psychromonas sp. psych-6C06]|uniref:16S rRNA (guanine(1207)-N(2))-methyltransferase RsmC n=1 Tax=Psychromonas sp. psych-6C06 TaxID=2058089 RepID=UPI000C346C7D|nr:16S rRNA (guanine(1207)-N(2))-methyltransferase RsmC [Psychromonas sp. psych-6C06]PKF62968.1 16S rRNA (guanine(1207)-N(2))-methyltransferase RsmC [Psychromonas sp. psych-6C06]